VKQKRILIVNVNWLGDVLFSTPLIRALRQKYPNAYVACMVIPRCREVLEHNPRIDELLVYDEEDAHKGVAGKLKFISELHKKNFSEAIILHRSLTRTLLVALAKVPKRIGYYTKKRGFLLTEKPLVPDSQIHRIDLFCELGEKVGVEVKERAPEFYIKDEDRKFIENYLKGFGIGPADKVAVLNPGGNWMPKRWPVESFAKLAAGLVKELGFSVVISGAKKDKPLARDIARLSGVKVSCACGETTLKELGALMERAELIISNDSGPLHVAAAMGQPLIGLFGPTSPDITGPRGRGRICILQKDVSCKIPCYKLNCADNRCMKAISAEDVFECVRKILGDGC